MPSTSFSSSSRAGWLALALLATVSCREAVAGDSPFGDQVTLTFENRVRGELVDWFRPAGADGEERYAFLGNRTRFGLGFRSSFAQLHVELQDTRLVSLPDDAIVPPGGALGPGAIHFAHTRRRDQGETILAEAWLNVRRRYISATVGRFEHADGLETIPGDRALRQIKETRIGQRLLGPFGYTHVARRFDGIRLVWDRGGWNATAIGLVPTAGGFEVSATRHLEDVTLAGLTVTRKPWSPELPMDLRLFYLFYGDRRRDAVKVDNRPPEERVADRADLAIHTLGGHAIAVREAGPGAVDGLFWFAVQTGDWGRLDHHRAWAWALEGGYELRQVPWTPWLRVGWNRSSGDDDPTDGDHSSFFQIIPTARVYAQLPFFNAMNSDDLFAQIILNPHWRVKVRADVHRLRLTEARDLWYAGGGATRSDVFGFGGLPSGSRRDLAWLLDLSVSLKLDHGFSAYLYAGRAIGEGVVRRTFVGENAAYAYAEVGYRY